MKLYSRIIGKGDPVIILHGLFGTSDNWYSIGKQLAEYYKCYLLDLRNHGRSDHSPELNYDDMVEDLYEFLTDFELRTVSIIGHSMGGMTAMKFAVEYPHRVNKLVIVDIAPKSYPALHQNILSGLKAIPVNTITSRQEADKILAGFIDNLPIRRFLLKSLQRTDKNEYKWRFNLDAIAGHTEDIGRGIRKEFVYKQPSLFIRGERSSYLTAEDIPLIKERFPNSIIESIKDGTHWLHAEKPKELMKILKSFLMTKK
jgi:pimeloyl-ACP methyl ester carboxylesterase